MGRPYPFFIVGSGPLRDWEEQWDLLPFACENTWCQLEYLATHRFDDVKKLEAELAGIRPPSGAWEAHAGKRKSLNEIGSPLDPYASFLDLKQLQKQAAGLASQAELFVSLERGASVDKILQISLWHHLFREIMTGAPSALFLGGTLEKAYLAVFKRSLSAPDFIQLWSVSSAGLWKNTIGAEYAMDLSSLGKEPVSAERPCGSDVRYDPAFEELQAEVDKLSSPSASGTLNWEKIVRFASDILAHKSKDLVVASYLAVALIYTRQHDGFAIGLKLLLDLMGKYWEELYPSKERMRGRQRSMEWWAEKSEAGLKQLPPITVTAAQAALLRENVERLDRLMRQHLDGPPSLAAIREWIGNPRHGGGRKCRGPRPRSRSRRRNPLQPRSRSPLPEIAPVSFPEVRVVQDIPVAPGRPADAGESPAAPARDRRLPVAAGFGQPAGVQAQPQVPVVHRGGSAAGHRRPDADPRTGEPGDQDALRAAQHG